jgi:hypothetical protein
MVALFLLWPREQISVPGSQETATPAPSVAPSNEFKEASQPAPAVDPQHPPPGEDRTMWLRRPEVVAALNEGHNVPVAFYGQVVDQDSNGVPNATIDLHVKEEHIQPFPEPPSGTNIFLQRQTGADGRFEVSGLTGHSVFIDKYAKEGYEPEVELRGYGDYAAESGSFEAPVVFRLWNTNFHQQLITGEKRFQVLPDGRHYGIDLIQGTIAEGDSGDLVVWIKRPELPQQKYAWSCGMSAPGGGLRPETDLKMTMSCAQPGEYTNVFVFDVEYNTPSGSGMTFDNRFYVRLHNGQLYGRLSADFWTTDRHNPTFGLVSINYVINPSGSRVLW